MSSFWLVRVGGRVSVEGVCSLSVSCVCKKSNTSRGWPSRARSGRLGTPRRQGALRGSGLGHCVLRTETGGSGRRGWRRPLAVGVHSPCCVSTEKRVKPSWASRPCCLRRCVDSVLGGGRDSRSAISVFLWETESCAPRSSPPPKQVRAQTLAPWLLVPSVWSSPPLAPPLA